MPGVVLAQDCPAQSRACILFISIQPFVQGYGLAPRRSVHGAESHPEFSYTVQTSKKSLSHRSLELEGTSELILSLVYHTFGFKGD